MRNDRQPKPTIDAVNDAIGALSDLLHSLRAHAKASAADVKSTARTVKRDAKSAGRGAVKSGKRTLAKAAAVGEGLLERASKAWHDLTDADDAPKADDSPATSKRRRRAK